jgi:hypothetical protein
MEVLLFTKLRPYVRAFLEAKDADLAPIAGVLALHLLEVNNIVPGINAPNLGCVVCKNVPFACLNVKNKMTRGIVGRALLKATGR